MLLKGRVVAVSCDHAHRFSKLTRSVIRLIAGHGVEGDVHAGRFVKHRYLARRDPEIPNIRQILLIPAELFEGVQGPRLNPGQLGENITTSGIDLHDLPLDSLLHLGRTAVVALTGLRTPCGYIDKFRQGLKRQLIVRSNGVVTFRAGVLAVVQRSGDVAPDDSIIVELPVRPWTLLPAI